jgi:putative phosphoesterase
VRVAALYDIHGNAPALEAVLAEVEEADVDCVVVGGDVLLGPLPGETLALLEARADLRWIRGNTDRHVLEPGAGGDVWAARARWVHDELTAEERDRIAAWPQTIVLDVDVLGPTLFCHGSPRSDEEIVTRATPEGRLREILADVSEPVVVLGHTHVQFDRTLDEWRVVNAGSVGMPYEGATGAYWVVLGPEVDLRRTGYDVEAAAARIRASGYPDADAHAAEYVLASTDPDEATTHFERLASGQSG